MNQKSLLAAFLFLLAALVYANDAINPTFGGNEYTAGEIFAISIEDEVLTVDLFESYYHVTAEYSFENYYERAVTFDVSFPEISYEITDNRSESDGLRNFKTSVNGMPQSVRVTDGGIFIDEKIGEKITKFYTKRLTFPSGKKTSVKLEYDASYNKNTKTLGYCSAEYLLGSAAQWRKLEHLTLKINIRSKNYFLDEFDFDNIVEGNHPKKIRTNADSEKRTLELEYASPELELETKIKICLHHDAFDVFGLSLDYNFESFVYPDECFALLTKEQLRKSRNLIYAYHGYSFKSKDLQDFFGKWKNIWYKENENFSEDLFTYHEKANLKLIKKFERE